jgi:hypothetical protein
MKRILFALASSVLMAGGATAAPVGMIEAPAGNAPMIEQVNGNHRSCGAGPAGWHYHYRGQRIACGPRPSGRYWGWTLRDGRWGWWHSRERRWN